jgi:hypothetical protein
MLAHGRSTPSSFVGTCGHLLVPLLILPVPLSRGTMQFRCMVTGSAGGPLEYNQCSLPVDTNHKWNCKNQKVEFATIDSLQSGTVRTAIGVPCQVELVEP